MIRNYLNISLLSKQFRKKKTIEQFVGYLSLLHKKKNRKKNPVYYENFQLSC